jgi:diguanylate cyclase (GGDEF)-like protein
MNLPWIAELLPFKALARVPVAIAASPKPQPPPSDIPVDDWNDLLRAVKARLQRCVADPAARAVEVRSEVLDCVAALDYLQAAALLHDGGRRQQLEHDLLEATTALTQTQAQLRGTQAGERLARHLATHDPLTTLPNRSCFRERLDRALSLERSQRQALAVMYIDLDGFKPINDRHGHGVGDEVLRIVALRLLHAVRAKDMISRLGGDEFACLVADWQDREQLSRLACKVFDAVAAPLTVGSIRVSVLPSIGIAMYPTHGLNTEPMMRSADAAMYRAKRSRSGYAFCEGRAGS